jgi:excinuclease ABC subunit C
VDISTNQGKDTVGSLVWFEAGRPKKSEYRKFKIKGQDGPGAVGADETSRHRPDDVAAVHEVVTRYIRRRVEEGKALPDLIVIDGGKGQLNAARTALQELGVERPLASLAKRDEEIYLPGRADPIRLPRSAPSLRLLQRARDEAHRFAVTFNRHTRSRRTITSALLDVPGVGPNRRRALLERFGSLAGVKTASVDEIATVPGISRTLAQRILEHVHQ